MFIVDGDKHFAHANNCFPKRICSITLYKKYLSLWVRCLYVFLPPLCSLVWSGEMVGSLFCLVCLRVALVVILQGLIPLLSLSLCVQCFQFLAFLVLFLLRFCCQLKFALFYPPYCASSVFVTFLSVMPCLVTSSFISLALCLACTVFSFFPPKLVSTVFPTVSILLVDFWVFIVCDTLCSLSSPLWLLCVSLLHVLPGSVVFPRFPQIPCVCIPGSYTFFILYLVILKSLLHQSSFCFHVLPLESHILGLQNMPATQCNMIDALQ